MSISLRTIGIALVLLLVSMFAVVFATSATYAQTNPEINYQGKLTDTNGAAVPDGTYNMRFWLIDSPSAATTTAVWTEELTGANRVQVTNGLFSVMLGSTTALTSVDFNQTLYLGVEIGSTTASALWDGEMSPRKIIGTVPAAFEARQLGGVASSSFLRSDVADTASGLLSFTGGFTSSASSTIQELHTGTTTVTILEIDGQQYTSLSGGSTGLTNVGGALTANISESHLNITGGNPGAGYFLQASSTAAGGFIWVASTTAGITDAVTLNTASYDYLSLSGQEITLGQIDIGDDTNLTVSAEGITLSDDDIALAGGYEIPLTASTSDWNTAYLWGDHSLGGYLTDITGQTLGSLSNVDDTNVLKGNLLSYNGSSWATTSTSSLNINTDDLVEGSNQFFTNALARAAISETITGLTYTSGTGVFSLDGGYEIPLTASTSDWNTAYLWGDHSLAGYQSNALTNGYVWRGGAGNTAEATSSLFIADDGKVGVGTVSPSASFAVAANSTTLLNDGFEDNTIPPFTTSGNANWATQGTETYAGSYAAKAGTIGNSQSSTLTLSTTTSEATTISFYYKVSSEEGFDALYFKVNDEVKNVWSGEQDWTMYSLYLPAGTYQFDWEYVKDDAVGAGSDTAWVDNVSLMTKSDTSLFAGQVGIGSLLAGSALNVDGDINTSGVIKFSDSTAISLFENNTFIGFGSPTAFTGTGNVTLGAFAGASTTVGESNTFIGNKAGRYSSTSDASTFVGGLSGQYNSGTQNSFFGYASGRYNTGGGNTGIGQYSAQSNSGNANTMLGYYSGSLNSGSENTLLGYLAGYRNNGSYNNAIGYRAGYYNDGILNDMMGYHVGRYLNSTGTVAIGGYALRGGLGSEYNASNNVAIGYSAGYSSQTGADNNILIGFKAADSLTTGANNIIIGYDVEAPSNTGDNQLNIGNLIFGTGLTATGTDISNGNLGIGTTSPSRKLTVAGDTYIGGALRATGTVQFDTLTDGLLLADGSGNLSAVATNTLNINTDDLVEGSNQFFTNALARAAISETITGLTYTSGTGVFSLDGGYEIPLTASTSDWNTAYLWGDHSAAGYQSSALTNGFVLRGSALNVAEATSSLFIADNGYVGIGTTSPTAALEIVGDSLTGGTVTANDFSLGGSVTITNSSGNLRLDGGRIQFSGTNAGVRDGNLTVAGTGVLAFNGGVLTTGSIDAGFSRLSAGVVALGDGTTDDTTGTLIAGNIGIGTTSPSRKLTVAGDTYIGGALRATGTIRFDTLTDGLLLADGSGNLSAVATNTLNINTDDLVEGSNQFFTNALARAAISETITGITYTSGTGVFSLDGSYNIPLTASTTNWNTFYDTPSNRITAGDGLAWTSNTIDIDINELSTDAGWGTGDHLIYRDSSNGNLYKVAYDSLPGAGGGLTSLNGLTDASQSFATTSDTNIELAIVSSGSTHTFNPTWVGTLAVSRGGTGAANAGDARTNLGVAIGSDVQAWDTDLDTWAGVTPSANGQSLVSAADYAAMRGLLDLEAGTDFYSISAADAAFEGELDNEAGLYAALSDVTDFYQPGEALNSGSITSGFGNIDNGSSNLTSGGTITFGGLSNGGFLTTNGSGVLSTSTVGVADLTAEDFGDFTCDGATCTLDATYLTDITGQTLGSLSNVDDTNVLKGNLLSYNGSSWATTSTSSLNINTDDLVEGSNQFFTNALARAAISETITGITYTSGTGVFSLDGSYNIPLTASTTNWNTFYDTPSNRITAGTGLSWTGNTLNVSGLTTSEITDGTLTEADFNLNAPTDGYILAASSTAAGGFAWYATSSAYLGLANSVHDAVTLNTASYDYLSLSGQEITLGQIDIGDDTNLTVSAEGITLSDDDIALAGGYEIPLTASTSDWNTAYLWGDHSLGGYLTDITGENLTSLSDVDTTGVSTSNILSYNGSSWVDTSTSTFLMESELDSEAELESLLSGVSNVFTNNDTDITSTNIQDNTLAFDDISYSLTLASNPALGVSESYFGTTGLIFEGSTADTLEGLLTSANITGSDKTWTLPNTTGTLITTGDSGTVTGTMISNNTVGLDDVTHTSTLGGNPALATGQCFWASTGIICEGSSADTNETLLTFANPTTDRTITFPDEDITVAGLASAMTGTFDGNNFAGGAIGSGDLLYGSGAGAISELGIGTTGQVLWVSGGLPAWTSTSSLGLGTGDGTVTSVDMSVPTGFSISGNPITTSGTLALTYAAGYEGLLSASSTNWNTFYDTPSNRITAGTGLSWSTNTLNVGGLTTSEITDGTLTEADFNLNAPTNGYILAASSTAAGGFAWYATSSAYLGLSGSAHSPVTLNTASYDYLSLSGQEITLGEINITDDTNLSVNAEGLTLSTSQISLASGYVIPTTTRAANWDAAYTFEQTPSSVITAGNNIDWTGNTLNVTGLGDGTFLGLSDTPNAYTANSLLYMTGSALATSTGLVFDGTNLGVGTTSPASKLDVWGSFNVATTGLPNVLTVSDAGYVGVGNDASAVSAGARSLIVGNGSGAQGMTIIAGSGSSASVYFGDTFTTGGDSRQGQIKYNNNGDQFEFYTAGTNLAMVMDSSQNVGIGSSSPSRKLTVNGDIFGAGLRATGTITFDALGTGGAAECLQVDSAGNITATGASCGGGSSLFTDAGALTYLTSTSDLFAIGTSSALNSSLFTISTSSSNTALSVAQYGSGDILNLFDGATEVFTVLNGGNVGIGTSSPSATLTIDSSNDANGGAFFLHASTSQANYAMTIRNNGYSGEFLSFENRLGNMIFGISQLSAGGLYLQGFDATGATQFFELSEIRSVYNGGNFGIGTSSPASKLDVWGGLTVGTSSVPLFAANTAAGRVAIGTSTANTSATLAIAGDQDILYSNPGSRFATAETNSNVSGFAVAGNYLYAASSEFEIFDISDLENTGFVKVGSYAGISPIDVVVSGHYAYAADNVASNHIRVFDVRDKENPILVTSLDLGANAYVVETDGHYLYAGVATGGTYQTNIIDISDPTNPRVVGGFNQGGAVRDLKYRNGYLYVASETSGDEFDIYDVTDPTSPVNVGGVVLDSNSRGLDINKNFAYVVTTGGTNDLDIINIASSSPYIVGSLDIGTDVYWSVKVVGDYAYVGSSAAAGEITVVDVSNPAAPKVIDTINADNVVFDIETYGNTLLVGTQDGDPGVEAFDLGGFKSPTADIDSLFASDILTEYLRAAFADVQGGLSVGENALIGGTLSITGSTASSTLFSSNTSPSLLVETGYVGIGTSTPNSKFSLQNTGFTGAGVVGIDQYLTTENATLNAIQYGNRFKLNASNTATTTLVGSMYRIVDDTTFGNTIRGLEVQANKGGNTQGENTALSGFARTFGVRGYSSGDAGGTYEPAGGFFETGGTTQGNAIRGYSSSITTAALLSLYQDTSAFTGTGLLMNFGNGDTGSFTSTSTGKYLDFQNEGTSVFTVTAFGTTTIGDGTTNNPAGLQIGYGGLCVDNDGTCAASVLGRISSVSTFTGNSDLAEMYFSSQDLVPGEIVVADDFISVKRAEQGTGERVLGVISTKPGLLLGSDDESLVAGEEGYPLALSGRVPVRLSDENGPVAVGDPLTLSSIPGVAMKATEAETIVGYALESFDGTSAYTEGYINQFGDDIAEPNYDALNVNYEARAANPCYFGGGGAMDEEEEACDPSAALEYEVIENKVAEAEYEAMQDALNALRREPAEVAYASDGDMVRVGNVTMFVERGINFEDGQLTMLNELTSTSTDIVFGAEEGSGETLWSRLKTIAQSFVDGVLTIAGIKAERVETSELCVDDVCVDANDLRALLQAANTEGQFIEVTPVDDTDDTSDTTDTPDTNDAADSNDSDAEDTTDGSDDSTATSTTTGEGDSSDATNASNDTASTTDEVTDNSGEESAEESTTDTTNGGEAEVTGETENEEVVEESQIEQVEVVEEAVEEVEEEPEPEPEPTPDPEPAPETTE